MKKFLFIFLFPAILLFFLFYVFVSPSDIAPEKASADGSTNEKRISYIRSYGWEVSEKHTEKTLVLIPDVFSESLREYNEMQKKSGFDLTSYRGKEIARFSYKLVNHPLDKNYARVNLFVHKGKIIAADVSSTKLDGFMHSIGKKDF